MPKSNPTSEQLHLVVELIAGINDDYEQTIEMVREKGNNMASVHNYETTHGLKSKHMNPGEKLKEALSSKTAFQKCYLVRIAFVRRGVRNISVMSRRWLTYICLCFVFRNCPSLPLAPINILDAFEVQEWSV